MRVAALDCGTNSVRLLVADVADGTVRDVHRETRIVRLGQGVDRTGRLAADAIERARGALADYARIIADTGAERVRMVATSATRDARNRDEFLAVVHETVDVEPEVVTGLDEARLSYTGAVGTLPGVTGRVLLVDLGGGSTELVLGGDGLQVHSMDVGSVRMTERHLHDDPPTTAQVDAVVADVRAALDRAGRDVPLRAAEVVVGVAGTVTTLAALILDLPQYDSAAIHGSRFSTEQVDGVTRRLIAMSHDERAAVPVIHPGRVDVITAGAIVLRTVLAAADARELVASEHDILDGIALSIG
jgi:exopolyphosphatase / guanosine-5'-triphosphate,3'-diphosphate pyrophosphatase